MRNQFEYNLSVFKDKKAREGSLKALDQQSYNKQVDVEQKTMAADLKEAQAKKKNM